MADDAIPKAAQKLQQDADRVSAQGKAYDEHSVVATNSQTDMLRDMALSNAFSELQALELTLSVRIGSSTNPEARAACAAEIIKPENKTFVDKASASLTLPQACLPLLSPGDLALGPAMPVINQAAEAADTLFRDGDATLTSAPQNAGVAQAVEREHKLAIKLLYNASSYNKSNMKDAEACSAEVLKHKGTFVDVDSASLKLPSACAPIVLPKGPGITT